MKVPTVQPSFTMTKNIFFIKESVVKRDWFRILSPAIFGIIFSVIGIITNYSLMEKSGGCSFMEVIVLAPIVGILIAFDCIVKLIFKNTLIIWPIELMILGLIHTLWISKFTG